MPTAMLSPKLIDECESLGPILAPYDFGDAPPYVMNLPPDFPRSERCTAFTSRGVSFALRDALTAEGRWRGLANIIAFARPVRRIEALGITVHELAHDLPYEPAYQFEDTPVARQLQLQSAAAQLNRESFGDSPTMPRWYEMHGWQFIRVCLHLHFRAWQAGFEIGLPEIHFAGYDYDLSAPWCYRDELRDEPRRMYGETFATICDTTPPAGFHELFADDFRAWQAERRKSRDVEVKEQVI